MRLKRADFADLSNEVFARRGFLRFRAGGHSMRPLIRDGDILTIEPVDCTSLRVGDVAFYRPSKDLVIVHRVVARRVEGGKLIYLIRGDASTGPCERVSAESVLGRAVLLERDGRMVRLDRGLPRLVGLLWVKLSPGGNVAYAWWSRLIRLPRRALRRLARIVLPSSLSQSANVGTPSPQSPLSHSVEELKSWPGGEEVSSNTKSLHPPLSHSVGEGSGVRAARTPASEDRHANPHPRA